MNLANMSMLQKRPRSQYRFPKIFTWHDLTFSVVVNLGECIPRVGQAGLWRLLPIYYWVDEAEQWWTWLYVIPPCLKRNHINPLIPLYVPQLMHIYFPLPLLLSDRELFWWEIDYLVGQQNPKKCILREIIQITGPILRWSCSPEVLWKKKCIQ